VLAGPAGVERALTTELSLTVVAAAEREWLPCDSHSRASRYGVGSA
jgi:hypothetical protein